MLNFPSFFFFKVTENFQILIPTFDLLLFSSLKAKQKWGRVAGSEFPSKFTHILSTIVRFSSRIFRLGEGSSAGVTNKMTMTRPGSHH